jgi:hypothetical protein
MSQNFKSYTSSLAPEQVLRVAAITARHGDYFSSQHFALADDKSDIAWCEAQQSDEGLWDIYDVRRAFVPSMDETGTLKQEPVIKKKKRAGALCFFDALYHISVYELSELAGDLGRVPEGAPDNHHYKEFARKEGIVFDHSTALPLPVADGKIIGDDYAVSENDMAITARSKGNLSENVRITPASMLGRNDLLPAALPKGAPHELILQAAQSEAALVRTQKDLGRAHDKQIGKLRKTLNGFNEIVRYEGKAFTLRENESRGEYVYLERTAKAAALIALTGLIPSPASPILLVGGIGIAGIVGFLTLIGEKPEYFLKRFWTNDTPIMPGYKFHGALSGFKKEFSMAADPDIKAQAGQLIDHFELAKQVLNTRYAFNRAAAGKGFGYERKLSKEIVKLTALADDKGLSPHEAAQLIESIKQNPGAKSFEDDLIKTLGEKVKTFETLLDERHSQKRKQLGYNPL